MFVPMEGERVGVFFQINFCNIFKFFLNNIYYYATAKTVNTRNISGMLLCCKKKANQA